MKHIFLILCASSACIGCNTNPSSEKLTAISRDTIIDREKNRVRITRMTPYPDSVILYESVTTLLIASEDEKEKKLLRGGGYDSLNFITSSDGDTVEVRNYAISGHTLNVKIYYISGPGKFFLGDAELDKENRIFLRRGKSILLEGYEFPPPYYSLEMKIHIPDGVAINKVYYITRP